VGAAIAAHALLPEGQYLEGLGIGSPLERSFENTSSETARKGV